MDPIDLDDIRPADHWREPDIQLQTLIHLTERDSLHELDVTLITSGGVVTGTLIKYEAWAKAMVEQFMSIAKGAPVTIRSELENLYGLGQDDLIGIPLEERTSIHLGDPMFFAGPVPIHTTTVARMRLAEVVGWVPGRVELSTSPE